MPVIIKNMQIKIIIMCPALNSQDDALKKQTNKIQQMLARMHGP